MQQATSKPASCSADLCKTLPGFCPSDTDDESANSWIGKRDLDRIHLNMTEDEYDDYVDEYDDYVELTKRAPVEYKAVLYNGAVVIVTAAAYPPIGKLFTVANNNQVIRQAFRLIPGYCIGPSIQTVAITVGTAGILAGLQSEHPIDVSSHNQGSKLRLNIHVSDKSWRTSLKRPRLAFCVEGLKTFFLRSEPPFFKTTGL